MYRVCVSVCCAPRCPLPPRPPSSPCGPGAAACLVLALPDVARGVGVSPYPSVVAAAWGHHPGVPAGWGPVGASSPPPPIDARLEGHGEAPEHGGERLQLARQRCLGVPELTDSICRVVVTVHRRRANSSSSTAVQEQNPHGTSACWACGDGRLEWLACSTVVRGIVPRVSTPPPSPLPAGASWCWPPPPPSPYTPLPSTRCPGRAAYPKPFYVMLVFG